MGALAIGLPYYGDTVRGQRERHEPVRVSTTQREEAMRKDVEFKTQDGVTLAAWQYLLDQSSGKVSIVMAHTMIGATVMRGNPRS